MDTKLNPFVDRKDDVKGDSKSSRSKTKKKK